MRYVAAYILAVMGGNASPSAADLTEILGSVEVDGTQLDIVIKELSGKDVFEVMEAGRAKLADVPAGGGAPVASGGSAGVPAAGGAAEEKPKEKTPEPESDTDSDMGMGLFD